MITAEHWTDKPESGINIAFSFEGLQALGLAGRTLDAFPPSSARHGRARGRCSATSARARPSTGRPVFRDGEAHVLVMVSAKDPGRSRSAADSVRDAVADGGGRRRGRAPGRRRARGRTRALRLRRRVRPAVDRGQRLRSGAGRGRARQGRLAAAQARRAAARLPGRAGLATPAPPPDEFGVNGSYLVYRKLHQDVAAFRRVLRDAAADYPGGEELLAAKIVGRWRDGTPLDRLARPARTRARRRRRARNNAFDYGDDPEGLRCPVGAHVRRMNPRRSLPFDGKLVNRHRIMRRGITYGEPLPEGAEDDGAERGVIFMCLQASIARGFEFVQSQWANGGNAFRLAEDQDVIVGPHDTDGPAKMTIPG